MNVENIIVNIKLIYLWKDLKLSNITLPQGYQRISLLFKVKFLMKHSFIWLQKPKDIFQSIKSTVTTRIAFLHMMRIVSLVPLTRVDTWFLGVFYRGSILSSDIRMGSTKAFCQNTIPSWCPAEKCSPTCPGRWYFPHHHYTPPHSKSSRQYIIFNAKYHVAYIGSLPVLLATFCFTLDFFKLIN